jgi:hypothetical protein
MILVFRVMAAVLFGAAALLLWQQQPEYAFAAVILSVCSFFLAMRFEMKSRVSEIIAARQPGDEEEFENEDDADNE